LLFCRFHQTEVIGAKTVDYAFKLGRQAKAIQRRHKHNKIRLKQLGVQLVQIFLVNAELPLIPQQSQAKTTKEMKLWSYPRYC
jgi:hypothetical protein